MHVGRAARRLREITPPAAIHVDDAHLVRSPRTARADIDDPPAIGRKRRVERAACVGDRHELPRAVGNAAAVQAIQAALVPIPIGDDDQVALPCPRQIEDCAALSFALASATPLSAQGNTSSPVVNAGRLPDEGTPPTIDGKVDEAVWTAIAPHTTFIQQDPRLGEPATEKTEVRLLFSRTHVYASFICFDQDPSKIIMSQARRDASLAETDSVIAIFDTFNDSQNAFVFGTNPLGIEYDGQVAREGQTSGLSFGGGAAGTDRGTG